jgi:hypothetical protein
MPNSKNVHVVKRGGKLFASLEFEGAVTAIEAARVAE